MATSKPKLSVGNDYRKKWEELQKTLPDTLRTMKADRDIGRFTDVTVICDDGAKFKLHKLIICPQAPAIDRSQEKFYIEGQNHEFRIVGKSSEVVKAFFDLIYGIKPPNPVPSSTAAIKEGHLALMAGVYALADYLLAKGILAYVRRWFGIVLPTAIDSLNLSARDAIAYICENSAQAEPVMEIFVNLCIKKIQSSRSDQTVRTSMLRWFDDIGSCRVLLLKKLLQSTEHDTMKLLTTKKLEPLLELEGVDAIIIKQLSGDEPYNFDDLWNHKEFCKALVEKGELCAMLHAERTQSDYPVMPLKHCLECDFLLTANRYLNTCPCCGSADLFVQVRGYAVLKDGKVKRKIMIPQ